MVVFGVRIFESIRVESGGRVIIARIVWGSSVWIVVFHWRWLFLSLCKRVVPPLGLRRALGIIIKKRSLTARTRAAGGVR